MRTGLLGARALMSGSVKRFTSNVAPRQNMAEDKLVFGSILGFVGGLVILVYGAYEIYVAVTAQLPTVVVDAGIAGVVLGLLVMIVSALLASSPDFRVLLGVLIILFALISLVSLGGGDGVGFLLAVIGGACGIAFGDSEQLGPPYRAPPLSTAASDTAIPVKRPGVASIPPESQLALWKGCLQCGKVCPVDSPTCPNCGHTF